MKCIQVLLNDKNLFNEIKRDVDSLSNKPAYVRERTQLVNKYISRSTLCLFAFSMLCTEHKKDKMTKNEIEFHLSNQHEMSEHFKKCNF